MAIRDARSSKRAANAEANRASAPQWARIANDLAASIESGRFTDGATLPPASNVAQQYGVNRHTARQAFRHLHDLGLVSVERGRGAIVTGKRFPYRIGRKVSFRANFGAAGLQASGELLGCRLEVANRATADQLGIADGDQIWVVRMMSRAAGLAVSTSFHRLSAQRFPDFDKHLDAAHVSTTAAFRAYGINDYIRLSTRLTARAPTPHERRALGLGRGVPVIQSTALDGLEDGTPLQVVESAFSADRVEFVMELER